MTTRFSSKIFIAAALGTVLMGLGACKDAPRATSSAPAMETASWPDLAHRIKCLPSAGALVAAHRGTSRNQGLAENALTSLDALITAGIKIAEVDVSRLKSGEHILFHDGVWDDKSTGRGAVTAAQYKDATNYLLLDTNGRPTADRPALLKAYLERARGHIHVEIDFKSSANYEAVIRIIRQTQMSDDVVLIAYSKGQAVKLSRLAPKMALSVPVKKFGDIKAYRAAGVRKNPLYAWIGGRANDTALINKLTRAGIPILAKGRLPVSAGPASVIVSDYAMDQPVFEGAVGLSKTGKALYQSCLSRA